MKRLLIAASLVVASTGLATPAFAADVGVSITIGQPGFYGRIDIGDYPRPQLIYAEPILVERVHYGPPIYMRVPPGHAKHWKNYCHQYNACGERVYFVQDSWYTREYVPRYQEKHREHHDGQGNGNRGDHGDKGKGKNH